MEFAKYLILFLSIAAVAVLCGCMGSEEGRVLENATNESAVLNASPDVTMNAPQNIAVNATSPATTDVAAKNVQNTGQMVQVTEIRQDIKLTDPLFESDIVFEVKNIWDKDIEKIEVTVLKKECVGEPVIDFGRRSYTFTNLTSGEKEEFIITFRKFEGHKSGQKFTCPMSVSAWAGTKKTGDTISFNITVP